MASEESRAGQLHLLLVRHGQTQDNLDKILQGHRDTDLTQQGVRESQVLGDKLRGQHFDAIYRSPLKRMIQTIEPIVKYNPGVSVYADPDLRGQSLGELEGGSYDLVDFGNPRSADDKPGVEAFDDFVARLRRALARIVGAEAPKVGDQNRTVIIATHGVCITSMFKALEDTAPCNGFNPPLAVRGSEAFEVRWTDSDDVAKLIVLEPTSLPIKDGMLDWSAITGQPFLIEKWGKKGKAL